jgi:8-oxo-dGTP pyrophosphatase MutT (NUDIX family)
MHRQDLLNLLNRYQPRFVEESAFVARSRRMIQQDEKIFDRAQSMHVTGSAWVVNPARDRVFMVHHGKLHEWFQPGGHADGDPDVLRVALKETAEESGADPSHFRLLSDEIFDVDIHWVPATEVVPAHGHVDIRFLVELDDDIPLPGSHESHEVAWIDLSAVPRYNNNRSTHRMVEKTRRMRTY